MHAVFALYGKIEEVEILLRDMRAQKHYYKFSKGNENILVPMEGSVRLLPGGFYEYVFPKEDLNLVLTTLRFHEPSHYASTIPKIYLKLLKKMLRLKEIPKFNTEKKYLWIMQNIGIIPLGIREDGDLIEPENTQYAGYKHEAV